MSVELIDLEEATELIGLKIYRGDDMAWEVDLAHVQDDSVKTLTNTTEIVFTVKNRASDTSALIEKKLTDSDITIVDSGAGTIQLTLVPGDTNPLKPGSYPFDLEVTDDGNTITSVKGVLTILTDITRP